ncbi:ABC transporter substrate-binding protein [Jiangella asiatica]|uniref:Extracellular solute-binding protein n=1 Tax=Jiangella asiatica TaxID=2530372 RepID=A0A4V2Z2C1_9ACTN|nr:extracellular solute-binding protein [Jiangella asiatica]TDE08248.1 extracellular solute-binding protein [Jiangella asiatica]
MTSATRTRIRTRARRAAGPAFLAGALALATACGGGTGTSGEGGGSQLRAAWWGGEARAERFDQIVDGYEAQLDGEVTFKTEFAGFDQYWPRMSTQAAGKNLPDVMFITERQIADFAPALLDLQSYVDSGELDLSSFSDTYIESGKYDDELKMMPVGATYPTVQYNQVLFEEAGIPVPEGDWTWEDFKDTAVQLTQKLGDGRWGAQDSGGIGTLFENFLLQREKSLFEGSELNFDVQDLEDWLQLWEDLRQAGATPPGDVTVETSSLTFESSLFGTDKVAMFYTSHNQLPNFQGFMDAPLGLAPAPQGGTKNVLMIIGTFMSVSADTSNPEAAVGLLNHWVNDSEAIDLFGAEFGSPASQLVSDQISEGADEALTALLEYGHEAEKIAELGSPRPRGGQEVETIIASANENVASGAMTPTEAAETAYADAEAAIG